MRGLAALAIVCLLAGCGSAPQRTPPTETREPSGGEPRRGAYYKDDGPGANAPPNLEQTPDAVPRAEPLHRFANRPYEVFGRQYVPMAPSAGFRERGVGSWYGRRYHGQRTSSGEPYDMYAMTAAHPTLPIPSYARVTNPANGRSVVVRINDRGPFLAGRVIDLSYTAALKLGYIDAGSAQVEVESIVPGAATATPPAAAATATVAQTRGIVLQLGAFSARESAEGFRARIYQQLSWLNDPIEVQASGNLFRLHLGPFPSEEAARRIAGRIKAELGFAPVLVNR
jgi:rare lipoprotein A